MTDYGSEYADKRQAIISWRLLRVYREAQKDLFKKADQYARLFAKQEREMQRKVNAGTITEQDFRNWRIRKEFVGDRWNAKVQSMTGALLDYNNRALDIIRGEQYNVFAENANYQAYCHEKDFTGGISFDIYDETTVERLIREKPELLPRKIINGRKDKAWNQGIIANSITQGILQGESLPDIARRIARDTAERNSKAMVRYARTAMTAAQNAGRLETMHRAQDMGIKVKKVWMATLDDRTRDAHAELDGESVNIDEPFVNELGEIDYPGDPGASGDNTWNCRCTLGYEYPDYSNMAEQENNVRYDQTYDEEIENMSYEDWAEWRKAQIREKFKNADAPYVLKDVSKEYEGVNTPGKGTIQREDNYRSHNWRHEESVAQMLIQKYGGDVFFYNETGNVTVPDILWLDKQWEVKSCSSANSADLQLRKALQQTAKYNGNIIIDYRGTDITAVYAALLRRLERSAWREFDIMILHNTSLYQLLRNMKP